MDSSRPKGMNEIPPMPVGTARPDTRPFRTGTNYFFKKSNGYFIAVDAKNAWSILSGRNQVIGVQKEPWEYVGRTDGKQYIKRAEELRANFNNISLEEFKSEMEKALVKEFKLAKKDTTPPPNFDTVDANGMPINLSTYGQR